MSEKEIAEQAEKMWLEYHGDYPPDIIPTMPSVYIRGFRDALRWVQVPDAKNRYLDAMGRHLLKIAQGQDIDEKSGLNHFAHVAWNVLAVLELELRAKKKTSGKKTVVYPVMDM